MLVGKALLTEAEEEGVDTHAVHTEEALSDEVRSHHHCLQINTTTTKHYET